MLTKLYDPKNGRMRVAGFMSGSGSNLRKILDRQMELGDKSPYKIVILFSDNPNSNAEEISRDYNLPRPIISDIVNFYKRNAEEDLRNMTIRRWYDSLTAVLLKPFDINVIAYAGYMRKVTPSLIDNFLGINVHPADLSIMEKGKRKYIGDKAVRKAILAGEKKIYSTTHIVEDEVDQGKILMVSCGLNVNLPLDWDPQKEELVEKVAKEHQNKLKEVGDWVIFPKTLEFLARGDYSFDEHRVIYYKNEAIPRGGRWGKEYK